MNPSSIGSKVLNMLPQIRSYDAKSVGEKATGMIIELDDAKITTNFMDSSKIKHHLKGLEAFAR